MNENDSQMNNPQVTEALQEIASSLDVLIQLKGDDDDSKSLDIIAESLARMAEKDNKAVEVGEQGFTVKGIKGDKGDKGDTGEQGKKGDQGEQGVNGLDGADGVNGIDGTSGKNGMDGKDGINGTDGKKGKDGSNGKDGKDGTEIAPDEIVSKLESLPQGKRLKYDFLDGVPAYTQLKRQSSKTVSLIELDDVDLTGLTKTNGKYLLGSGSGGSVGGSNTQVQYNDSGVFGADAGFAWNKTLKTLSLTASTDDNSTDFITMTDSSGNVRFKLESGGKSVLGGLNIEGGAVVSGAWNAQAIPLQYGGTGQDLSGAVVDSLYGWDNTVGASRLMAIGSGLSYNPITHTISATGGGSSPSIGGTLTSATAGSVLFAGAGTFAQDNANFFWDDTNNRLGIGTATPTQALHVSNGSILVQPDATWSSGDTASIFLGDTGTWINNIFGVGAAFHANGSLQFQSNFGAAITFEPDGVEQGRMITNGNFGLGTTAPTHTLTLASVGTGIAAYNTTDQITNYERMLAGWVSNSYVFSTGFGGTGTQRSITISGGSNSNAVFRNSSDLLGHFTLNPTLSGVVNNAQMGIAGAWTSSAALGVGLSIVPTINQTSTAGYNAIFVSPFESAVGGGAKLLIDLGTNSAASGAGTHTSKFKVDNTGATTIASLTNGLVKSASGLLSNATSGTDYIAGGVGGTNQVAYFTGSGVLTSSANLAYDGSTLTSASPALFTAATSPLATNATVTSGNFWVGAPQGATSTAVSQYQIGGATTTNIRVGMRGATGTTPAAGSSYGSFILGTQTATIAATGTHPLFAQLAIKPLTISTGLGTLTNSASLYIEGAATNATNNYSLWIAAGTTRIDGAMAINLGSDATGDIYYRNSGGLLTRLPIGSTANVLTVASGIPSWAVPATQDDQYTKGLRALGSTSIAETLGMNLMQATSNINLADAQIRYEAVYVNKSATITGVKWYQVTQGSYTGDATNSIGLFSYNTATGLMTKVAESANTATLWSSFASNTVGSVAFTSPYAAVEGLYFVAMIYNNSAQVQVPVVATLTQMSSNNKSLQDFTNSAKRSGAVNGSATLPATQAMSGVTASGTPIWVELYS